MTNRQSSGTWAGRTAFTPVSTVKHVMAVFRFVLVLLVALTAQPFAHAAHEPDDWNRFHFAGNQAFSDSQLRSALIAEPDFLLANHPKSNNAQVHDVIKRLLVSGYQHAGFVSPTVEVSTNEQGITSIQVTEGPRYQCGPVIVNGATQIDAAAVSQYLTTPQVKVDAFPVFSESVGQRVTTWIDQKGARVEPSKPDWRIGSPVPFGSEKKLKGFVDAALKTMGFVSAEFLVTIQKHERLQRADLVIDLISEGTQDRIQRIIVDGCRANRADQIIKFLELQVGQVYDTPLKQRMAEKLWTCGRFMKYQFHLDRSPEGLCTLRLSLTEAPGVPALDEPLNDAAETLLKARAWLSQCDSRGEDLVFEPFKQNAEFVLIQSASGMIVQAKDSRSESTVKPLSLLVDSQQVLLSLGGSKQFWSADISQYPGVIRFDTGVVASDKDDQFATLNIGFNFHSQRPQGSPLLVHALNLSPAGWCAFAYKPNCQIESTGQTLRLSQQNNIVEVDRVTGRLIRFESDAYRIRVEPHAFNTLRQQILETCASKQSSFDEAKPLSSLVQALTSSEAVQSYQEIVSLVESSEEKSRISVNPVRLAAVRHLADSGLFHPLDLLLLSGKRDANDSTFEIIDDSPSPTSLTDTMAKVGAKFALKWLPDLFAEGTWPIQVSREVCLVLLQRGQHTNEVLMDLARDPSASPLRDSSLAGLLSLVQHPAARQFARRAIDSLEPDTFDRDLQLLLAGPAGKWFDEVMQGVGGLSDEEFSSLLDYVGSNDAKEYLAKFHSYAKADRNVAGSWYQATHENLEQQLQGILQR